MKTNIFMKTFIMLLVSFSFVFFLNVYISNRRFPKLYVEENITAVKESILSSSTTIRNGTDLSETDLFDLSSETTFIKLDDFIVTEEIGPGFISETEIIDFVITLQDDTTSLKEGNLVYKVTEEEDIYIINYIYEYEFGDYLIVSTRIQSLTNVDRVLDTIFESQTIYVFIIIVLLSTLISYSISIPLRKITKHAREISNLNFDDELRINRNDEFKDLTTSLNEMTFNLKKAYNDLEELNLKLSDDLDYEKIEEVKKRDLIMTINHEIKTPLAVLRGMIEGMIDNVGRYKNKDKYLQESIKHIDEIEQITKDLTYTLKLEDKKTDTDYTDASTLSKTITKLKEYTKKQKVKITPYIVPATLHISEELLDILFTNLLKNAILYTDDKLVKVDTSVENEYYLIEVRNKGHIKETDIEKIFDSFYQIKKTKEGSGLGLYIVKQICNLYHYEYKMYNDNSEVVTKIKIKCH